MDLYRDRDSRIKSESLAYKLDVKADTVWCLSKTVFSSSVKQIEMNKAM